jgi:hypothetical protein
VLAVTSRRASSAGCRLQAAGCTIGNRGQVTLGTPVMLLVNNLNVRPKDYAEVRAATLQPLAHLAACSSMNSRERLAIAIASSFRGGELSRGHLPLATSSPATFEDCGACSAAVWLESGQH